MRAAARYFAAVAEYPRLLWLLGLGAFLNVVGLSFIWPITTLYIHEHLGRPLTVAGWVLLLHSGGAAVGSLLGGYLFDRVGARRVMLLGLACSAVLIALPGLFTSWPLFVTVMVLYGVTATLVFPAMNALGARAWPAGGRRAFNFIYVAHNMGVAVGTALGGLLAQHSFQLAFLSASVMCVVFAVFVFFTIRDGGAAATAGRQTAAATEAAVGTVPWLPVGALFVGFLMCWLIYVQWQSAIAVHMMGLGYSLSAYSLLWTLNGLVIVAGQPLVALALRFIRGTMAQLLTGILLFAGSFLLLLSSASYGVFVAGMVILTLGEMFLWPGIPAAVDQVAPPARRGFLQGIIGSAATAGRMLGPLVGGVIFDHMGYRPLLITVTALLIIPALSFAGYGALTRPKIR
ncbi:MAG TPA: MFS transporter [Symbiobacteriaceae bacterium]|nr:MFS transporter [Symbiobacteriaceae bacterium]